MDDKQTIGNKIKTLRQRRRWSQEHLVELAREYIPPGRVLNRESISFYENGKTLPDFWVVAALARALGVAATYLLGEDTPAMLTPQPELWDAVEAANKQPPEVRRLLAQLIGVGVGLLAAGVSSAQPATSETESAMVQDLAAWAGKPADAELVKILLESLGPEDVLRSGDDNSPGNGATSEPENDTARAGRGSHNGPG